MNRRSLNTIALSLLLALVLTACSSADTTPPDSDGLTVRFATEAGDFVTVITDEESLARLDGAQSGDHVGIPNGIIRPGDGGVNVGHDWHLVEVELADMTMEVCDGTADYVDDLGYDQFVSDHGDRFCPWSATFLEIVRG